MVLGSNGKLGRAIREYAENHSLENFEYHDADTFDISDTASYENIDWDLYGTIINAAAYTSVDGAETSEGRKDAWNANVRGVKNLAKIATEHKIILVHISSDYVFDGTSQFHKEDEDFAPLSVYGQTKAAGDALVENVPQHYLIRSSWIIGEGRNFVTRMLDLAQSGASAEAPNDQFGRLTFTDDMAKAIFHLLNSNASLELIT